VSSTVDWDAAAIAVEAIAAGRSVVVLDDEGAEDGVVAFAAVHADVAHVAFLVRHTSGYITVALPEFELDRLDLPLMADPDRHRDGAYLPFAVSVDAREGVTTGISAADRARTIRLLADASTSAAELSRPGHVATLRARSGGVLRRPGRAEAVVDLVKLAKLRPAAAMAAVVSEQDPRRMADSDELRSFAERHGLPVVAVSDVVAYRRRFESIVRRGPRTRLPLKSGQFEVIGYTSKYDEREHIAFVCGEIGDGRDVLVRVHRECVIGDVFGSLRCRCVERLDGALAAISSEGRGVVVYIRNHDDRGSGGLLRKLSAYAAEDARGLQRPPGPELEVPADERDYGTGAQILADLGVRTMRMLTNSDSRQAGLAAYGLRILGRVPLPISPAVGPSPIRVHPKQIPPREGVRT
jgi:3,4-dihydroxy 2-butanone 4-phosphate synthase/GTP cyclohydrolase II